MRRLLHSLWDSLSHASPQRRSPELALSVWLPEAASPAAFQPTERSVLSNAGRKTPEETSQCRRSSHTASTAGRDAGYSEAQELDRPAVPADEFCTDALPVAVELRLQGAVLKESDLATSRMLPYLRMVMSLIEGVELVCREVVALLRQAMRQHSIGGRRRIDYLLGFLHQHPP